MNTNVDQQTYEITKAALCQGLDKARTDYKIAALTRQAGRTLYGYINDSSEILFEYHPTILPPKKFFFPQEETILEYGDTVKAKINASPLILFGIRPCDLNGLKLIDEAFAEGHGDPNYLAKREQAIIVGMECDKECDKHSFCSRVNSHNATTGFDLMLYPVGDKFLLKLGTEKGQKFVTKYLTVIPGNSDELKEYLKRKKAALDGKEFPKLSIFPQLFEKHKEHPVWDEEGSRCLSCGSCIMVCPTCYCFDVVDDSKLNLKGGERKRKWDACMLSSFAVVAGGENFRHEATQRLHHRIDRKFNFLMKKHGQAVCVGCGRCVRACLAEISPRTIAAAIVDTEVGSNDATKKELATARVQVKNKKSSGEI